MKMNKWEPRNYFLSLKKYFYEYEKIFLFSAYHLVVYLSPPSRFLSIRLHRNNQSYEHNILLYDILIRVSLIETRVLIRFTIN